MPAITNGFTVTQAEVFYFALFMLGTGVLSAGVAAEIRAHVEAALREAETRAQLKQVEHELQIAQSIQQSLLPKFKPQIAGFQVAGWSHTADDIGGDFYDWKRLPDGRWVVITGRRYRPRHRPCDSGLRVSRLFASQF